MFKICITVLLHIIQFSTDEDTLKTMKEFDRDPQPAVISRIGKGPSTGPGGSDPAEVSYLMRPAELSDQAAFGRSLSSDQKTYNSTVVIA